MLSKSISKFIQSLGQKKFRDEHGLFIAEGPKIVEEFLTSRLLNCRMICATGKWMEEHKNLLQDIEEVIEVTAPELEKISQLQTPKQVLGVFYKREEKAVVLKDTISLMLDEIQDPGNLGTIIRTADWFGIKNIICSKECADCYNPKVVQATMGSLARIKIIYTDLRKFLEENSHIKILAATLGGKRVSDFKNFQEGIVLIGNESRGIREELVQLSAEEITIPKKGSADSLNAGVAAGIILSHLIR